MIHDTFTDTNLPLPVFKKGKVRDIYDLGTNLLIVSTDRLSAFDVVLPTGIPHKGEALNRLSVYWFNQTNHIIQNHLLDVIDPHMVVVKKAKPIEIEFVVRGYLYGSAWRKYQKGHPISGIQLPPGMQKAEQLSEPILTPTTKAEVGHDLEMTRGAVVNKIGEALLQEIEETCLKIYEKVSNQAKAAGIIVADTKVEFGLHDGDLLLIDELFTPDSSRFWPTSDFEVGRDQFSFDKQYVRDYLNSLDWNKQPPAPILPDSVILETSRKYIEAYERLTGRKF